MKKVFKLMKLFVLVLLLGCSFSFVAQRYRDISRVQHPQKTKPKLYHRNEWANGLVGTGGEK